MKDIILSTAAYPLPIKTNYDMSDDLSIENSLLYMMEKK